MNPVRLKDALLDGQAFGVNGATPFAPQLNPEHGGQMGWMPNVREYVSNQAYLRRNIVAVVLRSPTFFNYMPNPDRWHAMLRAMIELHAATIDGLTATLNVETDTHPVGGAGELQHEVTNVTREQSNVTFEFVEKYGRPFQTMLEYWIQYGLMDPETKTPLMTTLGNDNITDALADTYSMTCMFFEPDPLHKTVVKAWLGVNMFPTTTGEIVGRRDLTSAFEILRLSVPFTGIYQYNHGVRAAAQSLLDAMNTTNANPYTREAAFSEIGADVAKAATGYQKSIEDTQNQQV